MSEKRRVVVTANIFPGLEVEQEALGPHNVEVEKIACRSQDELAAAGRDATALIVGNVRIDAGVLAHMPRCLAIVKPSVGVDNIDIEAATEAGVCVANVPDYGTDEVATHAMALLLNAIRYVDAEAAKVRAGSWQPKPPYPIQRSAGRTLGIIGFGRIGQSVARKAAGFDWRLLAWDPYVDDGEMRAKGIEPVDFETLLAQSDMVTLHLPLTEETQGMIDARRAGEDEGDGVSGEHGAGRHCGLGCAGAGGRGGTDCGGGAGRGRRGAAAAGASVVLYGADSGDGARGVVFGAGFPGRAREGGGGGGAGAGGAVAGQPAQSGCAAAV